MKLILRAHLALVALLLLLGPLAATGTWYNRFKTGAGVQMSASGVLTASSSQFVGRLLSNYSTGSSTGGFAEAYAACPAACVIMVDQDTTLPGNAAPIVGIDPTKQLVIEGMGFKLTCTATTGQTCLTIQYGGVGSHWPVLSIRNLRMAYSGAGTAVTGLKITNWSGYSIENSTFSDFSTTNSVALRVVDAFDGYIGKNAFLFNWTGLHVTTANQVEIASNWFQLNPIDYGQGPAGGSPMVIENTSNVRIHDGLIQSNNTTCGVKFWANAQNVVQTHLENMHFENQGDGTSAARQVCFVATTGNSFFGIGVRDNWFNAGTAASNAGKIFGLSGGGGAYQIVMTKNKYAGVSESSIWDGAVNAWDITCINELQAPATSPCGGVKLNDNTIVGGVSLGIPSSGRRYGIYAGAPGQHDGALNFYDFAAASRVAYIDQYGWHFSTLVYGASTFWNAGPVSWGSTTPTLGGSCPADGYVGGPTAGRFTVSADCGSGSSLQLSGLPGSNNAWACHIDNLTDHSRFWWPTSYGSTLAWFNGTALNGDVLMFSCIGY